MPNAAQTLPGKAPAAPATHLLELCTGLAYLDLVGQLDPPPSHYRTPTIPQRQPDVPGPRSRRGLTAVDAHDLGLL